MKAYVLHGIDDLRYEEVQEPSLKQGEVLVEVKAAGICGSDIPRIFENGTYSFPLIPGHEFSGVVVKTASEAEDKWLGEHVGVFPLLPCKSCVPCQKGHYEMCRNYSYIGSRTNGAFAQYVAVPVWNLIRLPEGVSFEAAAMLEPMAVAVHAMRSVGIGEGIGAENIKERDRTGDGRVAQNKENIGAGNLKEKGSDPEQGTWQDKKPGVIVCGLGTIGLLLTMFLKEAGMDRLLVIGNKEFQKENILALGIDKKQYFDSREGDVVDHIMEYTGGLGADVFFECVGTNETISEALLATAPGGRIQLVGNPASDMNFDRNTYWKILRNQLTVKGNWNSSYLHSTEDDWHYVLERLGRGTICPERYITQRFSLKDLKEGLHIMKNKTREYVKVMIVP